jgi:hypothetical protein
VIVSDGTVRGSSPDKVEPSGPTFGYPSEHLNDRLLLAEAAEIMDWLDKLIANSSDAVILVGGVASTAALALVVALISRRLLFSLRDEALESYRQLPDFVHGSLLACLS